MKVIVTRALKNGPARGVILDVPDFAEARAMMEDGQVREATDEEIIAAQAPVQDEPVQDEPQKDPEP